MGTAVYLTKACGVVAVIFLIGTFFFPRQIMAVLTNEEELIVLGGEYLRVIGISYVLSSIAQTFLAIMKNCNAVNISTLINSVMVILNIILNAVFIFGLFGCPEMGILWTKSLNCRWFISIIRNINGLRI